MREVWPWGRWECSLGTHSAKTVNSISRSWTTSTRESPSWATELSQTQGSCLPLKYFSLYRRRAAELSPPHPLPSATNPEIHWEWKSQRQFSSNQCLISILDKMEKITQQQDKVPKTDLWYICGVKSQMLPSHPSLPHPYCCFLT